jgi:hypothetical protein
MGCTYWETQLPVIARGKSAHEYYWDEPFRHTHTTRCLTHPLSSSAVQPAAMNSRAISARITGRVSAPKIKFADDTACLVVRRPFTWQLVPLVEAPGQVQPHHLPVLAAELLLLLHASSLLCVTAPKFFTSCLAGYLNPAVDATVLAA